MTYWEHKGTHQKVADVLTEMVPDKGIAQDTRIELFRRASNTYYEVYNNGGCNFCSGMEDENDILDDGVSFGLNYLPSNGIPLDVTRKLAYEHLKYNEDGEFIGDTDQYFEAACEEMDQAMDAVIEYIMSLENDPNFTPILKEVAQ